MKELEIYFTGGAKVKGFEFTQVKFEDDVYMYEVDTGGSKHYEVFERKERKEMTTNIKGREVVFEAAVCYPTENGFGLWAYCCSSREKAEVRFKELQERVRERLKESL